MEKTQHIVLVFTSVHAALEAEAHLKSASWPFLIVPLPPSINEGCGLGIQISPADQQVVEKYLGEHQSVPVQTVTI